MEIEYSKHWTEKHPKKKKGITKDVLEFAINNSIIIKDDFGTMLSTQFAEFHHQEEF